MANKAAGELTVTIDGKEYLLRPSFAAVMEFEDKSGLTVYEAMSNVGNRQSVPIKSVTAAFHACIKAGWKPSSGRPPTFDEIGIAIRSDGISVHLEAYMKLLTNMLTGEKALAEAEEGAASGKA